MKPPFRRRSEELLDKELRFHLDEQIAEYISEGMAPDEARRRALLEFGGLELAKEECRDTRPLRWLDAFLRDLRQAWRMLARSPGFAATSIVVLGLGIGAVTAAFTVINDLAIQTPPFAEPERLAVIREDIADIEALRGRRPPPILNFYRVAADLRSFQDLTAYQFASYEMRGLEEAALRPRRMDAGELRELVGAEDASRAVVHRGRARRGHSCRGALRGTVAKAFRRGRRSGGPDRANGRHTARIVRSR